MDGIRVLPDDLRVLVVQMGARHEYEHAVRLEAHGALAGLYTSGAWADGAPSLTRRAIAALRPTLRPALSRRTVRRVPADKVYGSLWPDTVGVGCRLLRMNVERRYRIEDFVLGLRARTWGIGGADIVLNTTGNGGADFLRYARDKGLKIVTDIVITPRVYDILIEERARWPGWEEHNGLGRSAAIYRRHIEEVVGLSDLLLCPSETVVDGLHVVAGFDPARVARVPYGYGGTIAADAHPLSKRILFAGEPGLRKGLPYLGQAATQLKRRDPGFEIVIAGGAAEHVRRRPECRDLVFLGHLGPAAMEAEFSRADVFCLPSLAEGSARVVFEAMARGVPSVVTHAAGSVITDGIEGRIVPERDGEALAEAITAIALDRDCRSAMSAAARQTVACYSDRVVGDRLLAALGRLAPAGIRAL